MPVEVTEETIRIRVRNPDLFRKETFRTLTLSAEQGIKMVAGRLKKPKPEQRGKMIPQTYLFDKDKWTVARAQAWVDEHKKDIVGYCELCDKAWLFIVKDEGIFVDKLECPFCKKIIEYEDKGDEDMKLLDTLLGKSDEKVVRKFVDFEIKDANDEERSFWAVASTETRDRDGDEIVQSGWKLKNFRRNPVVMWGHDYRGLPIAKALEVKIENNKLMFKPQFATKEQNPMGDQVFRLYKDKFLRTFSVGFVPIQHEDINTSDDDKKKGLLRGRRFLKQELLEISCVPVPSNPEAIVSGNKDIQEFMAKSYGLPLPEERCIGCGDCKKGVIPFKSYPKEPEGAAWDAGREVREAETSDLKIMATWFDSENPEAKGSYKLPHHKADNKHTVWRAVAAGMAALLGARGGVRLPSGDRKGVYNHLAKHYKEFDKEAPEFRSYEQDELKGIFDDVYYDELLDIVTEEQNSKDFEDKQKRGRVLSEKNRTLIRKCADMLAELLKATEDTGDDGDKSVKVHLERIAGLQKDLREIEQKITNKQGV